MDFQRFGDTVQKSATVQKAPQYKKAQCRMPQRRKATVQKDMVQNNRNVEMGNVHFVLSSRFRVA